MTIELNDVRRIAEEVVSQQDNALRVLGVRGTEGGGNYTELFLTVQRCAPEPCLIALGLDRNMSESALRSQVAERVRKHLLSGRGDLVTKDRKNVVR